MHNPSYLIKSRHDVFYFRYPLPIKALKGNNRICLSLGTRCPKQALRLANTLAYHGGNLISGMDFDSMDHAEIMSIMKSYYADVLEHAKAQIDKDGTLSKQKVETLTKYVEDLESVIAGGYSDIPDMLGVEYENPDDDTLKQDLKKIMERHDLSFAPDSREYGMMKSAYKHLRRNYCNDLLAYNKSVTDFSFLQAGKGNAPIPVNHFKPEHRLGNIIKGYLEEIRPNLTDRSHSEQSDCLDYLIDWLGEDFPITKIDDAKAREAKEFLIGTPKGRNKTKLTAGKPLAEQIALGKEHGLETLSAISVNKYLGYFETLFNWTKRNRFTTDNPFSGIRVKASKRKNRREMFSKDEVKQIIKGLGNGVPDVVKNNSNYWGALIAVYTGARRNEIAGLLPDDVKQDAATGIWYFDITDEEEEGKAVKTEAGKRIVPVHSYLIERGFLDFVKESRAMKGKSKNAHGHETRLLYDLTYTEHEKWGRNLGRWFNETYLKELGLKTKKKTMHSLRHSFITFLGAAGVDGANIKSIVGHEPDTVTTQVYTHYGLDHLAVFKDAIEKLDYVKN